MSTMTTSRGIGLLQETLRSSPCLKEVNVELVFLSSISYFKYVSICIVYNNNNNNNDNNNNDNS